MVSPHPSAYAKGSAVDGQRFDDLTRLFANGISRRRLLGGLAAGAAGLIGHAETAAATCRKPGRTCRTDANCCSNLCGPKDATGRHRCLCQSAADCPVKVCQTATCTSGVCATAITPGVVCDDGNL